jgi:hypothetical protein
VRPTVTASTMIARFDFGRKVRCHTGVVEKSLRLKNPAQITIGEAKSMHEIACRDNFRKPGVHHLA